MSYSVFIANIVSTTEHTRLKLIWIKQLTIVSFDQFDMDSFGCGGCYSYNIW